MLRFIVLVLINILFSILIYYDVICWYDTLDEIEITLTSPLGLKDKNKNK